MICINLQVARSKLGDHDFAEYVHYITYIACTVVRIFLPCYFGNLVLSASEALSFRFYSSGWLDMSVVCRKKMIILMERMKRPTVIWAWILFPLTLEIFKSVKRAVVISFCFVFINRFFVDYEFFVHHANVATKFQLIQLLSTKYVLFGVIYKK